MLPRGERGDRILSVLLAQLPGITDVGPWDFDLVRPRASVRTDYAAKVKAWATTLEPGALIPMKAAREHLGCSPRQWERIAATLKDATSDLALTLGAAAALR